VKGNTAPTAEQIDEAMESSSDDDDDVPTEGKGQVPPMALTSGIRSSTRNNLQTGSTAETPVIVPKEQGVAASGITFS